jgi:hypothetical protein
MTTADSPGAGTGTAGAGPDALREDIARTREQLGETVEALVARTDIKARVQQRAAEAVTQARQQARQLSSRLPDQPNARAAGLAMMASVVLLTGWLLVRRARRAD